MGEGIGTWEGQKSTGSDAQVGSLGVELADKLKLSSCTYLIQASHTVTLNAVLLLQLFFFVLTGLVFRY